MTVHNPADSTRLSALYRGYAVLEKSRAERCVNTGPALSNHTGLECDMPLIPDTLGFRPAQGFTDPLIEQARIVNEWAEIERRLAIRRALRPQRSDAAKRGWEVRRG